MIFTTLATVKPGYLPPLICPGKNPGHGDNAGDPLEVLPEMLPHIGLLLKKYHCGPGGLNYQTGSTRTPELTLLTQKPNI